MSYSSFTAEGYRGLGSIELTQFGRVNLISGRNDAGKTSLLEALYLHACGPFAGGNALLPQLMRNMPLAISATVASQTAPWDSLFFRLKESSEIRLEGIFGGRPSTVELTGAEPASQDVGADPVAQQQALRGGGQSLTIKYSTAGKPPTRHRLHAQPLQTVTVQGLTSSVFGPTFTTLDPPADPKDIIPAGILEGASNGAELAQIYSTLRTASTHFDLVGSLRVIDERIRGLEILVTGGQSSLHADIDGVGPIPISLLGGGPVSLASYILGIVQARGGALMIDEIEAGIHWTMLKHLWSSIAAAAAAYDVQVFATTHSRECLLAAAEALEDSPETLVLHRLHRDGPAAVEVTSYDKSRLDMGLELNLDLR